MRHCLLWLQEVRNIAVERTTNKLQWLPDDKKVDWAVCAAVEAEALINDQTMAVLFVVYMPNEDRESSEDGDEPLSPAPLLPSKVASVNGSNKVPYIDQDGVAEDETVMPRISTDVGEDDDFSAKRPLLRDSAEQTSNDKPADDDDRLVTKHQSLSTLDVDQSIPRQSSDSVLTKPENMQSDDKGVVYKGDKVRFQVTKLDIPDTEAVKQSAAEVAPSVAELVTETKEEKKQSLIPAEETDVVMERLTLKEVSIPLCHFFQ